MENKKNNRARQFKILKTGPNILVSPEKKLVVLWSAKSGSAFILKWYLYQLDLLEKAKEHSVWIHDYRKVLNAHPENNKNLRSLLTKAKNYHIIKLVRNPFTRAVSSYVQFLDFLGYKFPNATNFISDQGNLELKTKYSFEEFLDKLLVENIRKVNVHWRCQTHPTERRNILKVNRIIKLENVSEEIKKLEVDLDLKPSNLSDFATSFHHINKSKELAKSEFIGNTPLDISIRSNSPGYECFYNEDLKQKVLELYKEDFERYNYSQEL